MDVCFFIRTGTKMVKCPFRDILADTEAICLIFYVSFDIHLEIG